MRAISLWQPWASLFVAGPKKWETRHWPTNHRGWLVIHAAQHKVRLGELTPELVALSDGHGFDRVPYGALLGAVWLDHCQHIDHVLVEHLAATDPDSLVCGNWANGRWAWRRSIGLPLEAAIPYIGRQGFFDVPDETFPPLWRELVRVTRCP